MMAQAACDLADVVRRCLCHEAMGSGGQAGEKEVTRREHCRRVTRLTHAVSAAKRVSSMPFIARWLDRPRKPSMFGRGGGADAGEMDHVNWPEHIEVELTFLPTEHGGRKMSVFSGYRPQFYYGGNDWDAVHQYIGVDEVKPGESAVARLSFLSPQSHAGRVFEGMPFLLREGNRVVGYGRITRLLELRDIDGATVKPDGAMAAVVYLAFAFAAVLRPTTLWAEGWLTGNLVLLAVALLGAIYSKGGSKVFWGGFAIVG